MVNRSANKGHNWCLQDFVLNRMGASRKLNSCTAQCPQLEVRRRSDAGKPVMISSIVRNLGDRRFCLARPACARGAAAPVLRCRPLLMSRIRCTLRQASSKRLPAGGPFSKEAGLFLGMAPACARLNCLRLRFHAGSSTRQRRSTKSLASASVSGRLRTKAGCCKRSDHTFRKEGQPTRLEARRRVRQASASSRETTGEPTDCL